LRTIILFGTLLNHQVRSKSSDAVVKLFAPFTSNRFVYGVVIALTLAALLLRVWNLPNSLQFLGDQGRDALIVADMFREFDPVFIGPVTSIGNMYLGPAYYYFMLPFLLLSYPSPLGPAYAVAVLGAVAVFLTFHLGKHLIGVKGALIAAFLFAFNGVAVDLARFSWNPNPAPFVSLVLLWSVWKAWQGAHKYWLLAAVMVSILLQLHYVAALGGVAVGIVWLLQLFRARSSRKYLISLIQFGCLSVLIVMLSFTPLVLFDLKNGGINVSGLESLVGENRGFGGSSLIESVGSMLEDFEGRAQLVMVGIPFPSLPLAAARLLLWATLCGTVLFVVAQWVKLRDKADATWLLLLFILVSLFGLAAYQHSVFAHYIAFLFPAVFLLYGKILSLVVRHWTGWIVVGVVMVWYITVQAGHYHFEPTGTTLKQLEERADIIHAELLPGEQYLLVLLAAHQDLYGMNYRYYLSIDPDKRPLSPEFYAQAETLVIINEEQLPDPTTLPIYEIQVFNVATPSAILTTPEGIEILVLRKDSNS